MKANAKKAAPVAAKKVAAKKAASVAVKKAALAVPPVAAKKAAPAVAPMAVKAPRAVIDRESADDSTIIGIIRAMPAECAAKKVQKLVNAVRSEGYRTSMARVERLIPDAIAAARPKNGARNGSGR
ncbi:hypothetical protein B0G84_5722 [Paraburkholderia sp. BL8N3]|nr:hypothetical protein [Paraburkholderia sp. BL8N3]TCK36709.1 hypothetical protein B0G84_5722 [Paraburkholderia sp. BL8N3]